MLKFSQSLVASALGLAVLAGPALAQEPLTSTDSTLSPFSGLPQESNSLDRQSGKGQTVISMNSNANLDGTVGEFTAIGSTIQTGTNTIAAGAFSGMAGIGTIIQNSGPNALIQSNTIFNVTMH
ncbi:hypothetical protein OL229_20295 [Neisseriaceae bacterium JH1-16]|nr:hypothetical protein [Neisseriaceae bacterium JH1-16]